LLLQTGAIGPMENNQRPDKNKPPNSALGTPKKPGPTFGGCRVASVHADKIARIHFVGLPQLRATTVIGRSYLEALGREPWEPEIAVWLDAVQNGGAGIPELVSQHIEYLVGLSGQRELAELVPRSYEAAFGRPPAAFELSAWQDNIRTRRIGYLQVVSDHLDYLVGATGAGELEDMITRSYQRVFGRAPFDNEKSYWVGEVKAHRYQFSQLVQFHNRYKAGLT
jgi:hypothetical protein